MYGAMAWVAHTPDGYPPVKMIIGQHDGNFYLKGILIKQSFLGI
jgi:hypothetical protein